MLETVPIVCTHDGCQVVFESKKARKEHVFQYHSSPLIQYAEQELAVGITRHDDGFLYCPCRKYKVKTVGALKRHAKKCVGYPTIQTAQPIIVDLANKCPAIGCNRSYNTRNALAVHVYEFHSNPKVSFWNQFGGGGTVVIERDQERYLHCPCGAYSVLTTAAMLRHAKTCTGVPLKEDGLDVMRRSTSKYSAKRRRIEMDAEAGDDQSYHNFDDEKLSEGSFHSNSMHCSENAPLQQHHLQLQHHPQAQPQHAVHYQQHQHQHQHQQQQQHQQHQQQQQQQHQKHHQHNEVQEFYRLPHPTTLNNLAHQPLVLTDTTFYSLLNLDFDS
ncbi:hypothetical protein BDR26DRAFT_865907 [Obelidium mucronatum]|nr:hypothetical protein BDR26DRAFT_865907 [Obelidium mucronatum]